MNTDMTLKSDPDEYVIHLSSSVADDTSDSENSSKKIVRLLKMADPRIKEGKFQNAVLDAIFMAGLEEHFWSEEKAVVALARMKKRYGLAKTKTIYYKNCDVLRMWKYENPKFIPDAFLIDANKRTIVCYEVEDKNPLNKSSLTKYAEAFELMDYIAWDLHLIAYDIFGNSKVIDLFAILCYFRCKTTRLSSNSSLPSAAP